MSTDFPIIDYPFGLIDCFFDSSLIKEVLTPTSEVSTLGTFLRLDDSKTSELAPFWEEHYVLCCYYAWFMAELRPVCTIIVVLSVSLSCLRRSSYSCNFMFSLDITLMVLIRADSCGMVPFSASKVARDSLLIFRLTRRSSLSCLAKCNCLSRSFILALAAVSKSSKDVGGPVMI